jgi:hypothetical protein
MEMIETSEIEITFGEDDRHTEARASLTIRGATFVSTAGRSAIGLIRTCRSSARSSPLRVPWPTCRTSCSMLQRR